MTPKGADLAATDLIEVSTLEAGSYVTKSITGQELIDAIPLPPTGLTVGTTPIASGTIGRVLFQGTGNVLQQSSSLFWDGTNNRLGIGTSSPLSDIDINKSVGSNGSVWIRARNTNSGGEAAISVTNDLYYAAFEVFGSTFGSGISNTALFTTQSGITNLGFATLGAANISFRTNSTGSNNERLTIFGSSGNIGINTTTDAGFKLDVNGTARVTNLNVNLSTGSIPFMGASGLVTQNNANLFWDNTNARLGIGTATPLDRLHISTNGNNIVRLSSNPTNANIISFRDIDGTSQGGFLATGSTFSFGTYRTLQTTLNGGIGGVALRTGNGANAHISFYSGNADLNLSTESMRLVASTGNLLINTTTDIASSKLTIESTTQGFLPPRMTTTQRNAIASPAAGLIVYDTTLNLPHFFNGTIWVSL